MGQLERKYFLRRVHSRYPAVQDEVAASLPKRGGKTPTEVVVNPSREHG